MPPKKLIDSREAFLTTAEAAARLGVTPRTVKEKCAAGIIRATKPGRDWLIPESAVAEYLNAGRN